jgi:hypothetical protein
MSAETSRRRFPAAQETFVKDARNNAQLFPKVSKDRTTKRSRHIKIDLSAITATARRCVGCAAAEACCCAKYEVLVSAREMQTIVGALPLAARHCLWLKGAKGFEYVFDEAECGVFAIDTHENGLCVFAYYGASGMRCSLHSVAEQAGIAPHLLKAYACTLRPLALQELPDTTLSICDDAFRFPCNRARKEKNGKISSGLLHSVEALLGVAACGRILKAANKGLSITRVPFKGSLAGDAPSVIIQRAPTTR